MTYEFKINDFEGPLDVLLHLIKKEEMDIMDIEIVKLTNQYLSFIESMKEMNLDIASNYLVMASELMYLKSKTLLPINNEAEEEEFEEAKKNLRTILNTTSGALAHYKLGEIEKIALEA